MPVYSSKWIKGKWWGIPLQALNTLILQTFTANLETFSMTFFEEYLITRILSTETDRTGHLGSTRPLTWQQPTVHPVQVRQSLGTSFTLHSQMTHQAARLLAAPGPGSVSTSDSKD